MLTHWQVELSLDEGGEGDGSLWNHVPLFATSLRACKEKVVVNAQAIEDNIAARAVRTHIHTHIHKSPHSF